MSRLGSLNVNQRCTSTCPSLDRLYSIARSFISDGHRLRLGLTVDDLVSAGWLGYAHALEREPHARFPSYYYQCARFAMLDEIRRWKGDQHVRGSEWVKPNFVVLKDTLDYRRRASRRRLTPEQVADFTSFCTRILEAREAELMLGLVVDDESIEVMAERTGRTRERAVVVRAQAILKLRRAIAA